MRPRPRRGHTRGSATARGYDAAWSRLARLAIAQQPWCSRCRTSGSKTNPLTGDHIRPLSAGGTSTLDNIQVLCRRCNSAKGARGGTR
ncbi:HNH endonuclease signature motif containing protein [Yinghuangia aomiensis]